MNSVDQIDVFDPPLPLQWKYIGQPCAVSIYRVSFYIPDNMPIQPRDFSHATDRLGSSDAE